MSDQAVWSCRNVLPDDGGRCLEDISDKPTKNHGKCETCGWYFYLGPIEPLPARPEGLTKP